MDDDDRCREKLERMGRFYSTANWKKLRDAQLARQPVCEGCEQQPATLVDHIEPIKRGGAKRERGNMQSLCRSCHALKTTAETAGKQWTAPKLRGCDELGIPNDPQHHWRRGG